MSDVLSALIVGCGNIAGGYDEARDGPEVLTHAGAYAANRRFAVTACVEPDAARRAAFMKRWNIPTGFADLAACGASGMAFDVASVCTPTAAHEAALEALLTLPVRAVFCEKPLTGDPARSRALAAAYAEAERPLAVNYMRRWMASMADLRAAIAEGKYGGVQSVVGHYAKGVVNCGSHMIDLLHFLIGPLTARAVLRRQEDYSADDPTLDARLDGPGGVPVYLIGNDSRAFFTFEIDIMMTEGRVIIEDLGGAIRLRPVIANPLFPSYRGLDRGTWSATDLGGTIAAAVDNLADHLAGTAALPSDGESAVAAEEVCRRLIELAEEVSS